MKNKKVLTKNLNNMNIKKIAAVSIGAIALLIIAFSIDKEDTKILLEPNLDSTKTEKVVDGDIVIPISDITETATIYPANINGTDLEVIAVKASDGSIRSAFNTCQVCYSSGRGYYVQEGNNLVCQNCKNQFSMDQVEVSTGGCNPIPITEEYKTVTDTTITISKEVLASATDIFANWK